MTGSGSRELGAQSIARAYELRDRVSDRENFFITFNYYRQAPRNLELARQTLESWIHKYPGDSIPHGFLTGFTSTGTGHHEKAAERRSKERSNSIRISPSRYYNAAFAYLYLNRLSEAEALLRKASERKFEVIHFSICRYFIAFLRDDNAAMEREMTQRKAKLEAQGWFEHQEALTLAYQGRLKEAARLSDLRGKPGSPGRFARASRHVSKALAPCGTRCTGFASRRKETRPRRCRFSEAGTPIMDLLLLWRFCGTPGKPSKIAAELEKRYPEDTSVHFSYLPALRALEALNQGDPAKSARNDASRRPV